MIPLKRIIVLCLLLIAAGFIFWGCGKDERAKNVSVLRSAGRPDSARALAISFLQQKPNQIEVWKEFVRASLDLCRSTENAEDVQAFEYLTEATLVCGAIYQVRVEKTDEQWLELGRMATSEVYRQIGRLSSTFSAQEQAVSYLKQINEAESRTQDALDEDLDLKDSPRRAQEKLINDYRSNAKRLVTLSFTQLRLLKALPETSVGASSTFSIQLEERIRSWSAALELEDALISAVRNDAHKRAETALKRAAGDYSELGYFLLATILENGVLP